MQTLNVTIVTHVWGQSLQWFGYTIRIDEVAALIKPSWSSLGIYWISTSWKTSQGIDYLTA